ncbi:MAG: hypothetical protein NVS3B25_05740 [Hymenobacter sp.]
MIHTTFRYACLLLVTLLANPAAWAQSSNAGAETTTAAAATPKEKTGYLSAALGYGSNSAFFGRTQTTAYPYLSQELTYTSKVGLWASVFNYDLLNTTSHLDETDASLGYDFDISTKADASISYSHFFFAPNSPLIKSAVNNALDAYVGYDWGYVYTRLNGSYLFGPNDQDFFLVLDNSRAFDIDGVFTPKGYLTFTPKFSLTAGTQAFAETSTQQQIVRGNKKAKVIRTSVVTESTRFTLLSYGLRLPVAYTLGKVSVEAAYRFLKPLNVLPDDDGSGRSYFTATLSVTL